MKTFIHLLGNVMVASTTSTIVWFAATFWAYIETQSVLSTSIMSGVYLILVALSGFWFGSIVDHNKKKNVMMYASLITAALFALALCVYLTAPTGSFQTVMNPRFWSFVMLLLIAVIAGNIRMIALSTLTTIMIPADRRDKMNGLVGTIMGVSFMVSSIVSAFTLASFGMFWILVAAVALTVLSAIHLAFLSVPENEIIHTDEQPKNLDIKGTIDVIKTIPGLFALIFFTTLNNFLGGVFMPLMDAYGLSLVSLKTWGTLWGVLGTGFIFGGIYIAKYGLGKNPLKTLFRINIILWVLSILMAAQPSIILLSVCMFGWICLVPFVEATEQTIIQKVVPLERQGRVFGFAQSVEQAASPVTAFLIGPITQFFFIPFMTTGKGVALIGDWFGVGQGRGIALVFIASGFVGLVVTLVAMRSKAYKLLAKRYQEPQASASLSTVTDNAPVIK